MDKERLIEEWKKITRDSDGKFHDSRVRSKRIKAQISSSSITETIRIFHKRPYEKFLQSWFKFMRLDINKTSTLSSKNFGNNQFGQKEQKQNIF